MIEERQIHLERKKEDTHIRLYDIVEELKKKFDFLNSATIPGHFREYHSFGIVSSTLGKLQSWLESVTTTNSLDTPITVPSKVFINHSKFPRPPNSSPKPCKHSKYDLEDCFLTVCMQLDFIPDAGFETNEQRHLPPTQFDSWVGKRLEIPLAALLDTVEKPVGSEITMFQK